MQGWILPCEWWKLAGFIMWLHVLTEDAKVREFRAGASDSGLPSVCCPCLNFNRIAPFWFCFCFLVIVFGLSIANAVPQALMSTGTFTWFWNRLSLVFLSPVLHSVAIALIKSMSFESNLNSLPSSGNGKYRNRKLVVFFFFFGCKSVGTLWKV